MNIKQNKEITISEIAKSVFKDVRGDLKPKDINNSVVSAIREINKKYPNLIKGINRGSKGKLVYL